MENQMSEKENPGMCDETLKQFGDFMTMIEEETRLSEMDHFDCSVCMDLLHLPHQIDPCRHTFCQSCLIRLSQAHGINCPICRGTINGSNLNQVLDQAIRNQHEDEYLRRQSVEMESGIYNVPMDWTPVEEADQADVIYMLFEGDDLYVFIPQFN